MRALRRHHLRRMKIKAKHVAHRAHGYGEQWAIRNYNHMAASPSDIYCNPRRNPWKKADKKSMQERKQITNSDMFLELESE